MPHPIQSVFLSTTHRNVRSVRSVAGCAVTLALLLPGFVGCQDTTVGRGVADDKVVRSREKDDGLRWSPQAMAVAETPTSRPWPTWRGAGTMGIAWHAELPREWPSSLDATWKQPLGTGWSSPIIADGRVFITDRQQEKERLLALHAETGDVLWTVSNPVDFDPHAVGRRHGNGPKATPTAIDGLVYSLGIAGWLQCVGADSGEVEWKVNLPAKYSHREPLPDGRAYVNGTENVIVPINEEQGGAVPLFGYTGSPVVDGDRIILQVGGTRGATVFAFDRRTGRELWRALDDNVSYSSPLVVELAGKRQVVVMTGPRVVGLSIENGQLLWDHPFQIQYDESISTPVVAGDLVIVTGDGHPLTALRIERDEVGFSKTVAWENHDLSSYLSSMVATRESLFGMNDDGQLTCVSLADGQTLWCKGNHGYYCSPVIADDCLMALNEVGELAVLELHSDRFEQTALVSLTNSSTWTVPAIAGRWMYIRADGELLAFELTAPSTAP